MEIREIGGGKVTIATSIDMDKFCGTQRRMNIFREKMANPPAGTGSQTAGELE
jgi:hypothetical protein